MTITIKSLIEQTEKGCGTLCGRNTYKDMNPRPCGFFDGSVNRYCSECLIQISTLKQCLKIQEDEIQKAFQNDEKINNWMEQQINERDAEWRKKIKDIYYLIGEGIEIPERAQRKLKDIWLKLNELLGSNEGDK